LYMCVTSELYHSLESIKYYPLTGVQIYVQLCKVIIGLPKQSE